MTVQHVNSRKARFRHRRSRPRPPVDAGTGTGTGVGTGTGKAPRHGRRRLVDYPRRGRAGLRRWLPSWRLLLGALTLFTGGVTALFAVVYARIDIPDENAAARQEANVYYWADGSQMVAVGEVDRQIVPLSAIPVSVRNAVVAAENASFYSDPGVSLTGQARAVVNMARGQEAQGGSTITQQYVKNTYLSQEQTYTRKFREFFIALKVNRRKSKNEILRGYLNSSWFGRRSYGIQAAAAAYYGIPAKDLDPSQAALMASLLKGADSFDPSTGAANHRRAVARWRWILDRQVQTGMMTPAERARYRVFPEPKKVSMSTSLAGQTGYLVTIADNYIKKSTGLTDQDLAHGGYRIRTTFDKDTVERLRRAVGEVTAKGLDPHGRAADRHVQVGAACVRPEDGAIVAVYGGADATSRFTDNADTTGVPVGSTFKPFALAAYLRELTGSRRGVPVAGKEAVPSFTALENALVTSGHAPYVQLGKAVGWARIRDTAVRSGLLRSSMAHLEQTFPIGTSTPSAIRMAGAYATFADDGRHSEPFSVTRVLKGGKPLAGLDRPGSRRVLTSDTAAVVTKVLQGVAAVSGTQSVVPGVASVATGASDRTKSAWFVGYDDDLSTAITLFRNRSGHPELLPLQGTGGKGSLRGNVFPPRIWSRFMGGPGDFSLNRQEPAGAEGTAATDQGAGAPRQVPTP